MYFLASVVNPLPGNFSKNVKSYFSLPAFHNAQTVFIFPEVTFTNLENFLNRTTLDKNYEKIEPNFFSF